MDLFIIFLNHFTVYLLLLSLLFDYYYLGFSYHDYVCGLMKSLCD